MRIGSKDHIKIKRLARSLSIPLYQAVGIAETVHQLYASGRFPSTEDDLAVELGWELSPFDLANALIAADIIDGTGHMVADHPGPIYCGYNYPRRTSPGGWRPCNPADPMTVEPVPGVYAVYLDEALVYVGQSTDTRARFKVYRASILDTELGFLTPWGSCGSLRGKVRYSTRFGDWAMRELRLIRRLQPPMNSIGSIKLRKPRSR